MISYHLEAAAAQDFPSNQNACNFFSIFFVHVFLQDKSYKAKILLLHLNQHETQETVCHQDIQALKRAVYF